MTDRRLVNEGRRIYDLHKSGKKFGLEDVEKELLQYANQNPDVLNATKQIHDVVKEIDESSRLRPNRRQLDLWPEDDLKKTIPTGIERQRIEWGKATDAEIDGWEKEETDNFLKIVTSYENGRFLRREIRAAKKSSETVEEVYRRKRKEKAAAAAKKVAAAMKGQPVQP